MTTAPPIPIHLCRQVARHWALHTSAAGGLAFVEPTAHAAGNIYAAPLPPRIHRMSPACSLTVAPALGAAGNEAMRSIGLLCRAEAGTESAALDMLAELRSILRPEERPWRLGYDGEILGPPAVASGGTAPAWRLLTVDVLSEAQPANFGATPAATIDGESAAQMTLALGAVPARLRHAVSIYRECEGMEAATVAVTATALVLTWQPGELEPVDTEEIPLAGHTITSLAAAVGAIDGWHTAALSAAAAAAPATRLMTLDEPDTCGAENAALLILRE